MSLWPRSTQRPEDDGSAKSCKPSILEVCSAWEPTGRESSVDKRTAWEGVWEEQPFSEAFVALIIP